MSFVKFIKSKLFLKQILLVFVVFLLAFFALKWWLFVTTKHSQRIEVPDLNRMTLPVAKVKLGELNLNFVVIDSANYNPSYPKRSVIEQNPEPGDFVKEKRKIYLTLNSSRYRLIAVPEVEGKTKRQATNILETIGFKLGDSISYVPDIGKDVVRGLRHKGNELKAGEKLPKNSIIYLILGDGNASLNSE